MRAAETIRREEELYELWERHAHPGRSLPCAGWERVVVISRGVRNDLPGPDYRDAVLLVNGELAVGPVEMHLSEGEWFLHGHQHDPAYSGVLLHLVARLQEPPALPFPTLDADTLCSVEYLPEEHGGELPPAGADAGLIAELAWHRLLRRATEVIRAGGGAPSYDLLRRAFLLRLFDALGYVHNRESMRELAARMIAIEAEISGTSFERTAALLFAASGADPEKLIAAGRGFMSESRLRDILSNSDLPTTPLPWRYDTRPGNAPERRLWGAAKLLFDLYHHDLLRSLCGSVSARRLEGAVRSLEVRLGEEMMVGGERGREIAVNALLPVALAGGILFNHPPLVEGACLCYRDAPSLASNRVVRSVEKRYLQGKVLRGAFWQQGAIEFHQRYLASDRSHLSFVAEGLRRGA